MLNLRSAVAAALLLLASSSEAFVGPSRHVSSSRSFDVRIQELPQSPKGLSSSGQTLLSAPPHAVARKVTALPASLAGLSQCVTQAAATFVRTVATPGPVPLGAALGVNALLFGLASPKLSSMLTPTGMAHAFILGTGLWTTLGYKGWALCVLYLIWGQLVTKVQFAEKEARGLAEGRGGRRGPENVWGSAATGMACAIGASRGNVLGLTPQVFWLGYVASLATKLADTFASEIGKAYGKTTFLITTLARVAPGTEGAISLEGSAASVLGGFLLSVAGYGLGFLTSWPAVALSTVAAFVATNIESFLGATVQGKPGLEWVTNEVINFWNTAIGAALAMLGGKLLLGM